MGIRWPTAPPRPAKRQGCPMAPGDPSALVGPTRGEELMITPNGTLSAALSYAARGWPVLPLHTVKGEACSCGNPKCPSPAKHPIARLAPRGVVDATTDEKIIKGWWRAEPLANVGVAAGPLNAILIVK